MKITDIKVFLTQPGDAGLVVVKVFTDQDGLHGLGCGTFTYRARAVALCVEEYFKPFLVGKNPADIQDIWQSLMVNSYWRNGPVQNNAISGIDMALWDIKGKASGMPCFQLWGGKSRPAGAVYVHADGRDKEEVADRAEELRSRGFRHIRCQLGGYSGVGGESIPAPDDALPGEYFDPKERLTLVPDLFDHVRRKMGDRVELLFDVHERLSPSDAIWLAKALEPYRLFFLEDLLAPEDIDWFAHVRSQCATPLAMGELFTHPQEVLPLVSQRLIDYIRVHLSCIGGVTPALKLAHLCEAFGVRTAWHGPGDLSPVGVAANVHLDVWASNFGIQEWVFRSELEREVFPGMPEVKDGYVTPNAKPGWGVDLDEGLAAKHPIREGVTQWTVVRLPDGSMGKP